MKSKVIEEDADARTIMMTTDNGSVYFIYETKDEYNTWVGEASRGMSKEAFEKAIEFYKST